MREAGEEVGALEGILQKTLLDASVDERDEANEGH